MAQVTGIVEDIVFRNDTNGWTVLTLKQDNGHRVSCVGIMPFINAGEQVKIEGEWTEHRDYGRQVKVSGAETVQPTTKVGIEKYLASGLIRGVGPSTAKLIVGKFGADTLAVMEAEPHRLVEVPGIGPKRAEMIIESFREHIDMQRTLMFLQGLGLSVNLSVKIFKQFGEHTERLVRDNPYRLADEVQGVGFRTADSIARQMGFEMESPFRLKSGVRFVLSEAVNAMGHMYLPLTILCEQAAHLLAVDDLLIDNTVRGMIISGSLVTEEIDGETAVYLPNLHDAEMDVARRLTLLMRTFDTGDFDEDDARDMLEQYERAQGVSLAEEQRHAVLAATGGGITIITGGPGTGKTTSINCIIRLMEEFGKVQLCAPTGRAAKRMTEATGKPARTIHRLLEYGGEGGAFGRNEDNPIDARTVIVDEMSMVDIFLMRSLLRAVRPGTRLVLVGDQDQLPSVGAGNVLRDLIASGAVPVVTLTEIFRQAETSMIVVNAHRINHGENPILNKKSADFFIERKESPVAAAESVVALVERRLPNYMQLDKLRDIQVMAPMKKGDAGVFMMNRTLQAALNPREPGKPELQRGDTTFRLGDKVMQIRNNYDIEWRRDGERGSGIFNGDVGFITYVDKSERTLEITFDDGREAEYGEAEFDELELAFCMSVHKSQGSEFDCVVLPLITGPRMLMTRNLLYTAVTRAKKLVVIVGRESCVNAMVENNHVTRRYSALADRLITMNNL